MSKTRKPNKMSARAALLTLKDIAVGKLIAVILAAFLASLVIPVSATSPPILQNHLQFWVVERSAELRTSAVNASVSDSHELDMTHLDFIVEMLRNNAGVSLRSWSEGDKIWQEVLDGDSNPVQIWYRDFEVRPDGGERPVWRSFQAGENADGITVLRRGNAVFILRENTNFFGIISTEISVGEPVPCVDCGNMICDCHNNDNSLPCVCNDCEDCIPSEDPDPTLISTPSIQTALNILRYLVDLPSEATIPTHDFNQNGVLDIGDALQILRYLVDLPSALD
ncbi:MAG: hypothetical protein FWF76_03270 [Oscillospiraceae bacterium]|nr:hypothetical protein [Oscillospiraceae bacterium]